MSNDTLILEKLDTVLQELSSIKQMQAGQLQKNEVYDKKFSTVENQLSHYDRLDRMRNVILFDVEESEESAQDLFNKTLEIIKRAEVEIEDTHIYDIHRTRRKIEGKIRPVIVKLIAPRWKFKFFEKEGNFSSLGVRLSSDLSKESRNLKNKLLKARYMLRKEGKDPILKGFRLELDGKLLKEKEIDKIVNTEPKHNSNQGAGSNSGSTQDLRSLASSSESILSELNDNAGQESVKTNKKTVKNKADGKKKQPTLMHMGIRNTRLTTASTASKGK